MKRDQIDKEVKLELELQRARLNRELTPEEVRLIHYSPKMHGWIAHCRANHERVVVHLKARGYTMVEHEPGIWGWERLV